MNQKVEFDFVIYIYLYNYLIDEPKIPGKSVLNKMRLIGRIVVDYLIDLFNRNSRDYREVSRKLSEMKAQDKITQQEERIRAQTLVETVNLFFFSLDKKTLFYVIFLGFSYRSRSCWS